MEPASDAAPVRLRLVVGAPESQSADVEVSAYPDAPVGQVVEALATTLGVEDGAGVSVYCTRTRSWLANGQPLAAAGLRQGDELVLAADRSYRVGPPPSAGTRLELVVEGGVGAGRRIPLAPGVHVVGRGDGSPIAIDDPSLSATHLRLTVGEDGSAAVEDLGSRNGTAVEGVALPAGEARPLAPGEVVQAGRTLLAIEPTQPKPVPRPPGSDGFVAFNRPPRVHRPLEPTTRSFPAPPDDPHGVRIPLLASLAPLALGVALYAVTGIPAMLLFALLTPVMAVSTFVEDRRGGKKAFARGARNYRERLLALRTELEAERARESAARRDASPSAPELLRRARTLDARLWERRLGDRDFLSLRVGSGEQPALHTVRLEPGGNEALRAEAERLLAWFASSPAAPVTLPLAELGAAGLCGPSDRVHGLARCLVAQAAALHSPRELVIAAALPLERLHEWEWLKWLPHVRADLSPLALQLVSGDLGARALVDGVAALGAARRHESEGRFGASARVAAPAVLLVLDESVAPERPLVADLLAQTDQGIAVLWLGRERRDLPGECTGIVELLPGSSKLTFTDARTGDMHADVTADALAVELASELALALAPVRDTTAVAGGGVPDRVSLLELLEVDTPSAEWVARRWVHDDDAREGVIGAAAQEPFRVDLRHDGPHALVAGMTGAGKSELLQTLIVSLAATYPPTRLTFLLIDYKGGAAFKECVGLPHAVGFVTDLDEHLTQRALVSLNAELQRRERILRDAGAKDLADMEARDREAAPPSLVIVIDEFATLAKEVPEFVDGVVDVAQRGRSLGVHLVLATQRPGGVVSENIRANTNLRIALRVNEAGDSTDVIGTADAARVPRDRPGRAYARTGHSELVEFQTGFVGGVSAQRRDEREIVVRPLRFESARQGDLGFDGRAPETDLQRLVRAVEEAARMLNVPEQPSPWLPPLEPVVPLSSLAVPDGAEPSDVAVLGLVDEPARQRQRPYVVELEREGSLLVYGASGSGKTTLLRTLALSLASRAGPDRLHLYGLDFATRGLTVLAGLPHCGAVIGGEDEERTSRLFSLLRKTMERRKQLFAEQGVFTLSEYRRRPDAEPLPRIVVLLDGYAGFADAFERVNLGELVDALPRLVGDGRPLGVHFAISADRRAAVPNTLAGIIPAKLVLRMADDDEFNALGIPLKSVRGAQLPPGRGFLPGGVEFQVGLFGSDPSGEGQAAAASALAEQLRARFADGGAPAVEPLPTNVERSRLDPPDGRLAAMLGVSDAELAPVAVELGDRHFLVAGPYRSGRSTALRTLAESLRERDGELDLRLLAPRRSPLLELGIWSSVARGLEACNDEAFAVQQVVESRSSDDELEPIVLVVDDAEELAEAIAAPALETIVRRGRDLNVRAVAAVERQAAQRAFAGWLRELRKEEYGLLLAPDADTDGDLLGVRLPRRTNPVFPPGRGYLVERGSAQLVQVATD